MSMDLIDKLIKDHSLSLDEYEILLKNRNREWEERLKTAAQRARNDIYGNKVYIRGLIEISNICKNDCLYCGIRRSNNKCDRYRLSADDIIGCCDEGYTLGFRTFVLQGGEDDFFTDDNLCGIIDKVKKNHPDCAVTLSLGERSYQSYKRLFDAGADRYLLRHETADKEHYNKLHPSFMSYDNRMECLYNLKEIGYQVGCGFMVSSPYQTNKTLAKDLKFIEEFKPDMCGIGPFIPHKNTPFANMISGSGELTCYLLSIIRLIYPNVLLPATTALNTICPDGREKGIEHGANVVMPNLSPERVKDKYALYNGKVSKGAESAREMDELRKKMNLIGCEVVTDKGDIIK